jgi:hypothetical protein
MLPRPKPTTGHNMTDLNPIHIFKTYFLSIKFNVILPPPYWSSKCPLYRFSLKILNILLVFPSELTETILNMVVRW